MPAQRQRKGLLSLGSSGEASTRHFTYPTPDSASVVFSSRVLGKSRLSWVCRMRGD